MLTVPEYIELPVPVLISSSWARTAPESASTNVCSTDGVWSGLTPVVTTSYASTGLPVPTQTTRLPLLLVALNFAELEPLLSAAAWDSRGVVELTPTLLAPRL